MRVLVTNDHKDLLALWQHILEARGHEVQITTNAGSVMAEVARFQPYALVLDWMLEIRTGGDVLDELRRTFSPPPPVLVISSLHHIDAEAVRRGEQAFLCKPFTGDALVAAVKALVAGGATG